MTNDWEMTLSKFLEEGDVIKKKEALLNQEKTLYGDKLMGFLKESGLAKEWTIPELMALAVRKSKNSIILP